MDHEWKGLFDKINSHLLQIKKEEVLVYAVGPFLYVHYLDNKRERHNFNILRYYAGRFETWTYSPDMNQQGLYRAKDWEFSEANFEVIISRITEVYYNDFIGSNLLNLIASTET